MSVGSQGCDSRRSFHWWPQSATLKVTGLSHLLLLGHVRAKLWALINGKCVSEPSLWRCEKGGLNSLDRLKVNQPRKIKEAHYAHHCKEPAILSRLPHPGYVIATFASPTCASANVAEAPMSISRKEPQHAQMKAIGRPTPKIIFRM